MAIPVRSSAADRTRPTLWDGVIVLLVAAAAAALLWTLRPSAGSAVMLRITLDGTVVGEYSMEEAQALSPLAIDAPWPVTLEAEQGRIRVAESSCPGRDCVHTGWIDAPGGQIICLPNRLIISLIGEHDASTEDFDVIAG